jgi:hypothetical protein
MPQGQRFGRGRLLQGVGNLFRRRRQQQQMQQQQMRQQQRGQPGQQGTMASAMQNFAMGQMQSLMAGGGITGMGQTDQPKQPKQPGQTSQVQSFGVDAMRSMVGGLSQSAVNTGRAMPQASSPTSLQNPQGEAVQAGQTGVATIPQQATPSMDVKDNALTSQPKNKSSRRRRQRVGDSPGSLGQSAIS